MKSTPRPDGWEPGVFRWSARALVVLGPTAGAAALVWGEDLRMSGWAAAIALLVALAALIAAFATLSAYRRQAALVRAMEREMAKRRHPSAPVYDQETGAQR